MTTRQFDPVFSAALRNELEAIADAGDALARPHRPHRPVRAALTRPQVWVSVITAVVLVAATIGVLHLVRPPRPAAEPRVVAPLSSITDPTDPAYVARSVQTLLSTRGTGPGAVSLAVPTTVSAVRIYFDCAPDGLFTLRTDSGGWASGGCSRDIGGQFGEDVAPGVHDVTVSVPKGTEWAVLVIAEPAPTVATGPLIDPLAAVRDLRNPDALTGDPSPVLAARGTGSAVDRFSAVPIGTRLRLFLVCSPRSSAASVTIDRIVATGCMNSIAHWIDFTTTTGTVTVRTDATVPWRLLLVRAPADAKDSPSPATLPYSGARGTVLARARGFGAPASGTFRARPTGIRITTTCRGTGWLEIRAGASGSSTRGTACSTSTPSTVGFDGDGGAGRESWSVVPHGDISWTFQLSDDD